MPRTNFSSDQGFTKEMERLKRQRLRISTKGIGSAALVIDNNLTEKRLQGVAEFDKDSPSCDFFVIL